MTVTATANGKAGSVTFDWTVTAGDATGTGLIGMYYDTEQFTEIKLVRVDPAVNFDWGMGAPAAGIGADTFSVRWVGQVEATTTGDVTFTLAADDGARLWVGDLTNPAAGGAIPAGNGTKTLAVQAGQKYDIVVQYREDQGAASAVLKWSWNGQEAQVIPTSRLYPSPVVSFALDKGTYKEGDTATLVGTFDPKFGAAPDITIDWGDGTASTPVAPANIQAPGLLPFGLFTVKHTFADDGVMPNGALGRPNAGNFTVSDATPVTVTVTAPATPVLTVAAQQTVTVQNVAPKAVDFEVLSNDKGVVTIEAKVTDVGVRDAHKLVINWGDGVVETFYRSPQTTNWVLADGTVKLANGDYRFTHNFNTGENGKLGRLLPGQPAQWVPRTITVAANDDDDSNTTVSKTRTIVTQLQPPSLQFDFQLFPSYPPGPYSANEGQEITVYGQVLNGGAPGLVWPSVTIDWMGDGTMLSPPIAIDANSNSFSTVFKYPNNGAYSGGQPPVFTARATATATGYEQNSVSASQQIKIANVIPSALRLSFNNPNGDVRTVSLTGTFTDPGTLDTHTVTVDWGDGTTTGPYSLGAGITSFAAAGITHTYASTDGGGYTIELKVADNDQTDKFAIGRVLYTPVVKGHVLKSYLEHANSLLERAKNDDSIVGDVFRFAAKVGDAITEVIDMTVDRAKQFVNEIGNFVDQLEALETTLGALFKDKLPKVLDAILEDPVNFARHFFDAGKTVFTNFANDLVKTAQGVLLQWAADKFGLAAADLPTAEQFQKQDWDAIGGFVLKALGLTWDDLLAKVTTAIGPDNLAAVLQVYDFVKDCAEKDGAAGQAAIFQAFKLDRINQWLDANLGDADIKSQLDKMLTDSLDPQKVKDLAIKAAMDAAVNALPGFITKKILQMFPPAPPGVGAGFTVLKSLYEAATWVAGNIGKVTQAVSVVNALAEKADLLILPDDQWSAPRAGDPQGRSAKQIVVDAMTDAIQKLGPIVLDFAIAVSGAGKVADQAVAAVKGLKDKIHKPIDDALAKVADAGKKILDKALNKIVPNSASSPDYKGLTGPVMTLTVDNVTHRVWARYNKATGKIEVMLASLPDDFEKTVVAWKVAWDSDRTVTKLITALQTELGKTTKEANDLAALSKTLADLAAKKPSELNAQQKEQLKQALKAYAQEIAGYQNTLETKDHKPTGTELALQNVLQATHGEWAPDHSMSGIKTANILDQLLKGKGKSLSGTDRSAIISLVERQGDFGGWGDETTLAREIVGQIVNSTSTSVADAISSQTRSYFTEDWITRGTQKRDGQLKGGKPLDHLGTGDKQYDTWVQYINKEFANKDARGRTLKPDLFDEYKLLNQGDPTRFPQPMTPHGHHIIFKKALGADGQKASREAKDILLFYGIDPYFSKENLAFAPLMTGATAYPHPDEALEDMRDRLTAAFTAGKPRDTIVRLLTDFALEYIEKRLRGM